MKQLLLQVDTNSLKAAGELAWKGMLSIFLVMGLIFAVIWVLNIVTNKSQEKRKQIKQKALAAVEKENSEIEEKIQ
ncbi:MAG: hypothetical protein LBU04_02445 [Christensenellaceae bacterium]|jgi:flagellar biogenesis protein FliO|nr:hypothetical protein [Christensenellaceae bacterium]